MSLMEKVIPDFMRKHKYIQLPSKTNVVVSSLLLSLFFCFVPVLGSFAQNDSVVKSLVLQYNSATGKAKKRLSQEIIRLNPAFDVVYKSIKNSAFSNDVQRGFLDYPVVTANGLQHPNIVFVPNDYDPHKSYRVRLSLHGAVSNPDPNRVHLYVNKADTGWASVEELVLFPAAWSFSQWTDKSQYENIAALLTFIKQTYNVDDNGVYIVGVSDGGVGTYHIAGRYPTPFASFVPFIGSLEPLFWIGTSPYYLRSYSSLPFFIVNTVDDPIFKFDVAQAYVSALKKQGGPTSFFKVDTCGHNLNWYPILKDTIRSFTKAMRRNPFPETVTFSADTTHDFNRKFWVEIVELGRVKGETVLDDPNVVTIAGQMFPAFRHDRKFGQIEARKVANRVDIKTSGVKNFRLLISSTSFDLTQPIEVYTNGILSFNSIVLPNVKTLLEYNMKDCDREMLIDAVVDVKVGKEIKQ